MPYEEIDRSDMRLFTKLTSNCNWRKLIAFKVSWLIVLIAA